VHRALVVKGLRAHHSYEKIAESIRDDFHSRPGTRSNGVYNLIFTTYGGLDKFLVGQGLEDGVELEEIVEHYRSAPPPGADAPVDSPAHKKRATLLRNPDPIAERAQLEQVICEGIKTGDSYASIAFVASEKHHIPTSVGAVKKIVYIHLGVEGFLEHMGESKTEAVRIATRYREQVA
jgi:hypothetical protein